VADFVAEADRRSVFELTPAGEDRQPGHLGLQPQPEIFVRRGGVTRVRPPRRSSRCEGTLRSGGGRAAQVKPCGVAGGIR
jgi:hypothetical protein